MTELLPIWQTPEENQKFIANPVYKDVVTATTDYYKVIGFVSPWIGYLVMRNGQPVGSAGYKGAPVNGIIEIAYGTFPEFRNQGIGTQICRQLVELAIATDPQVIVTARTLQVNSPSISILIKNGFTLQGVVMDKDDGEVLGWRYGVPDLQATE